MPLTDNIRKAKGIIKARRSPTAVPRTRTTGLPSRNLKCVHLGEPTGTTVPCSTGCGAGTRLKVLSCEIHGTCTVTPSEVAHNCRTCSDYDPTHSNVRESARFAAAIPDYPSGRYTGRGIVVVGGGPYWASVYVTVRMLRHLGCHLPVQVWYLGERERSDRYAELLAPWNTECIDAVAHPAASACRSVAGFKGHPPFEAKSFAVLHSPFEEVLYLDADNYPCADPTALFDDSRYLTTGGIFWPDMPHTNHWTHWKEWGVEPFGPACGWEVGQYVVSKRRAWEPLQMCRWYDDHGDWCYGWGSHHDHGDKGSWRVGWARFRREPAFFSLVSVWKRVAFVHVGPDAKPMFVHRCRSKFVTGPIAKFTSTPQNGVNLRAGLPMENEAFSYLDELRSLL